jgi:ribosomal protein L13
MSTYFPKAGEIARKWFVVDAAGQPLGRLASRVARILMGKENPKYTPFLDTGDHVVVINAEKIKTTGMKTEQKLYQHYTGYPGGLRSEGLAKRMTRKPGDRRSHRAHVAQEQAGQTDVHEAEGVQGRQASASGAETGSEGFRIGERSRYQVSGPSH